MTIDKQIKYGKLVPVMLCFFAMGFVDLVGIASNYVTDILRADGCADEPHRAEEYRGA